MQAPQNTLVRQFMRLIAVAVVALAGLPAGLAAQTETRPTAGDGRAVVQPVDLLLRARTLYNEGHYEDALEAARAAQAQHGAPATLILGRAGLERYRTTADPADLGRAREALRGVDVTVLSPRDRLDLVIGLGEALFFDEHYLAAADLFEPMLDEVAALGPLSRDQVLDWWATSIDRHVRALPPADRAAAFDRLILRMEQELRRDATSGAAAYWIAAAAFARGHVDRAWDAAVAGWVRGLLTADRGAALRPDLDRLVRDAIIPERLRRLPASATPDTAQAQASMLAEWELVKERWTKR